MDGRVYIKIEAAMIKPRLKKLRLSCMASGYQNSTTVVFFKRINV